MPLLARLVVIAVATMAKAMPARERPKPSRRAAERMLAEHRQPHRAAADQPRRTPGAVDQRLVDHEPLARVVGTALQQFRRLPGVEQIIVGHYSALRPAGGPAVPRGAA